MVVPKLTTKLACKVAGLHPDRFNEHVADRNFTCAPGTVPGRARAFTPDDMVPLMLFKQLMDDGMTPAAAGRAACEIGRVAREYPDEKVISFVEDYFYGGGTATLPSEVPPPEKWDEVGFMGSDIRKVTNHRIGKLRQLIAHYTEEEASIIGRDDD